MIVKSVFEKKQKKETPGVGDLCVLRRILKKTPPTDIHPISGSCEFYQNWILM